MKQRLGTGRAATVVAAGAVALGLGFGAPALAATGSSGSGGSPVLVGPLLQVFTFGASFGIPTGCQLVSSAVGSGAGQYGQARKVYPLIEAINANCAKAEADGEALIADGNKDDSAATKLNPLLDPAIAETGASVTTAGNTYGAALAPFGPTIAGLGGTIEFFEGN